MKLKKVFIWIISIILSLLSTITILCCNIAQDRVKVKIETLEGENYITYIRVGETSYRVKDFSEAYNLELLNGDDEIAENDKLLLKAGQSIEFETTKFHNLSINFAKKESNGKLRLIHGNKKEILNLNNNGNNGNKDFVYTNSMHKIIIERLKEMNIKDYVLFALLFIIFTLLYNLIMQKIINTMIAIKNNNDLKISNILFLFISYLLINIACMLPLVEILHKWYAIIIFIQIIFCVYYLRNNIKVKLHNIFALLAIILTVNMAILLPPFHVPDELAHFIKSYSIFNSQDIVDSDKPQIKIYDNTYHTITKYAYDLHNREYKTSIKEYFADMAVYEKGKKETIIGYANTADINPFAYIPSAIIVKISTLIGLPFMIAPFLGRIINALIFVIFGYLSVKIIPNFKKIMFMVMLFPITIQQVAAINQDSLTLSIIFLFISIVFKEVYDKKKLLFKNKLLILLLSISLGLCKPGYFPITLLVLLIPSKKFSSRKEEFIFKISPFVLCTLLTGIKYITVKTYEQNYEGLITFDYVVSHPLSVIRLFLYTIYQRASLDLLTGQLNLFGWSTVNYDFTISFIIYSLYFLLLFADNEKASKLKTSNRILLLIISAMIFGLIYVSAMIGFKTTYIDSIVISGLQSRYFIPVTLLLLITTSCDFIKVNFKNKNLIVCLLIAFTFLVSFYTIISGFYI